MQSVSKHFSVADDSSQLQKEEEEEMAEEAATAHSPLAQSEENDLVVSSSSKAAAAADTPSHLRTTLVLPSPPLSSVDPFSVSSANDAASMSSLSNSTPSSLSSSDEMLSMSPVIPSASRSEEGDNDSDIGIGTGMGRININAHSGDSQLHAAARAGDLNLLRHLVEEERLPLEQYNRAGKTPLHEATQMGHLSCVAYLISQGADIDAGKRGLWTPLMIAARKGFHEIVKLLLDHGADVSIRNKDGWTCFSHACFGGSLPCVALLLTTSVDPRQASNNGRTPFHIATQNGHEFVLSLMLSTMPEAVHDVDCCGTTPMMIAAVCGDQAVNLMSMIHSHGAEVNARDVIGCTALHYAAGGGFEKSVLWLLEHGADPTIQDTTERMTPLHHAAKGGHVSCCQLIMMAHEDKLAALYMRDHRDRTASDIALLWNRDELAKCLDPSRFAGKFSPDTPRLCTNNLDLEWLRQG